VEKKKVKDEVAKMGYNKASLDDLDTVSDFSEGIAHCQESCAVQCLAGDIAGRKKQRFQTE